jgi:hypothetical protein
MAAIGEPGSTAAVFIEAVSGVASGAFMEDSAEVSMGALAAEVAGNRRNLISARGWGSINANGREV